VAGALEHDRQLAPRIPRELVERKLERSLDRAADLEPPGRQLDTRSREVVTPKMGFCRHPLESKRRGRGGAHVRLERE
jgi:hypothetical protein